MKTTPAECALLALALAAPMGAVAQDVSLPDAALLEFLADWDEADPDWLDAELNAELNDEVTDGMAPAARTETGHE